MHEGGVADPRRAARSAVHRARLLPCCARLVALQPRLPHLPGPARGDGADAAGAGAQTTRVRAGGGGRRWRQQAWDAASTDAMAMCAILGRRTFRLTRMPQPPPFAPAQCWPCRPTTPAATIAWDWTSNHRDAADIIAAFRQEHRCVGCCRARSPGYTRPGRRRRRRCARRAARLPAARHAAHAPHASCRPRRRSLEELPLYALGVSVGGGFVLKLPEYVRMDGVLSEVLGPHPATYAPQRFPWGACPGSLAIARPRCACLPTDVPRSALPCLPCLPRASSHLPPPARATRACLQACRPWCLSPWMRTQ